MDKDRYTSLADLLVSHSTRVENGDVVVMEFFDIPTQMVTTLVERVRRAGGHPVVWLKSWAVLRAILHGASPKEVDIAAGAELDQIRKADVYISLRASMNVHELGGVSEPGIELFQKHWLGRVHYSERVHNTRWCSGKWPTEIAASAAGMGLKDFEKFFFKVCTEVDYKKMRSAMEPLAELLEGAKDVHITGEGTDIKFSIEGVPVVMCSGDRNIPDGEIFTAPIKESVQGRIRYNVPSSYQGKYFEGICLNVRGGRIEHASCENNNNEMLNQILNTDPGACYFGEFAFGVNPMINRPINDTMFDEKMAGSIHLTPGNSYKSAFNGNQSGIHWDLILNQTDAFGGGDVLLDGEVIRKNGVFVHPRLAALNPENLVL